MSVYFEVPYHIPFLAISGSNILSKIKNTYKEFFIQSNPIFQSFCYYSHITIEMKPSFERMFPWYRGPGPLGDGIEAW